MDATTLPLAAAWRIRPIRRSDAEGLAEFYRSLAPESRQTRFLGATPGIGRMLARTFCGADHQHQEGVVAVVDELIVGHLCLDPLAAGTEELAVAVADLWQRRGIGRALFESGLAWARDRSVRRIVATAYSWNAPVLRLLSSAREGATARQTDAGVVAVEILLDPILGRSAA